MIEAERACDLQGSTPLARKLGARRAGVDRVVEQADAISLADALVGYRQRGATSAGARAADIEADRAFPAPSRTPGCSTRRPARCSAAFDFLLGNYKAAHQYLAQVSHETNLFIDAAVDNAWALLALG